MAIIDNQIEDEKLLVGIDLHNYQWHVNGIESFYTFAQGRLMKFHGIAESTFYLHLKECEFRINNRNEDIYLLLHKMFKNRPLF